MRFFYDVEIIPLCGISFFVLTLSVFFYFHFPTLSAVLRKTFYMAKRQSHGFEANGFSIGCKHGIDSWVIACTA